MVCCRPRLSLIAALLALFIPVCRWRDEGAFVAPKCSKLLHRRDVTLREDACQARKGQAPRVLAILNSFLLALFDWLDVRNVASHMRLFAAQPFLALSLFMGSLERIK